MFFKSKRSQQLEALTLLRESIDALVIYKSQPRQLVTMTNRLNRRLDTISKKIVQRAMDPELHSYHEWDETVRALYSNHAMDVASLGVREIAGNPRVSLSFEELWGTRLDRIVEDRSFNASQRTIDRMTGDILERVKEGIREGRSLDKTDKVLREELTGLTQNELRRISLTETHSIYQQSKYESIYQSNAPYKRWIHRYSGPLPREWHEDMDGEVVPFDEPFSNGLLYPGDPTGDAEEVINCHCDMVPDWGRDFSTTPTGGET